MRRFFVSRWTAALFDVYSRSLFRIQLGSRLRSITAHTIAQSFSNRVEIPYGKTLLSSRW